MRMMGHEQGKRKRREKAFHQMSREEREEIIREACPGIWESVAEAEAESDKLDEQILQEMKTLRKNIENLAEENAKLREALKKERNAMNIF